uniref:Uncharacterized protein n=1 Tax=Ixodes ricinus TaxID=34613 RepID=A0A6B0U5C8_IXORI
MLLEAASLFSAAEACTNAAPLVFTTECEFLFQREIWMEPVRSSEMAPCSLSSTTRPFSRATYWKWSIMSRFPCRAGVGSLPVPDQTCPMSSEVPTKKT